MSQQGNEPTHPMFRCLLAVGLLLIAAGAVRAQTNFNLTSQQAENEHRLQRYQWRSEVQLTYKGEPWGRAVMAVRYDAQGKLVQTQIGGGGSFDPNLGLRIVQRNKREMQKNKLDSVLVSAAQQLRAYAELPPDRVKEIMSRAARTPATGEMAGTDQLTVEGVLRPDDRLTIWVDRQTGIQRRMELESTAGSEKFKSTWTFARLPNGPWYCDKRVVVIPGKNAQLTTTNSDFLG